MINNNHKEPIITYYYNRYKNQLIFIINSNYIPKNRLVLPILQYGPMNLNHTYLLQLFGSLTNIGCIPLPMGHIAAAISHGTKFAKLHSRRIGSKYKLLGQANCSGSPLIQRTNWVHDVVIGRSANITFVGQLKQSTFSLKSQDWISSLNIHGSTQ